jgi:Cupin-like domain
MSAPTILQSTLFVTLLLMTTTSAAAEGIFAKAVSLTPKDDITTIIFRPNHQVLVSNKDKRSKRGNNENISQDNPTRYEV